MYGLRKIFSLLLAICLLLGAASAEAARENPTLVVGCAEFSGAFSPFFGESAYDMDVAERMTGESLLVTDRVGGVILNGIEGETVPYNGVDYAYRGIADLSVDYDESTDRTAYTARLKPGVRFSDGEEMNADDVIFTYYVLLDPAYSGVNTLGSYDIVGLKAYQTQVPDEIYGGLAATAEAIYAAGPEHVWSGADNWTEEEQDAFWAEIDAAWLEDVAEIVGFVDAAIANDEYLNAFLGMDTAAYLADGTLKVPFAMAAWGSHGRECVASAEPALPGSSPRASARASRTSTRSSMRPTEATRRRSSARRRSTTPRSRRSRPPRRRSSRSAPRAPRRAACRTSPASGRSTTTRSRSC